ncbi:MAG: carboxypeptidase regulatory-like domain-containing protein [Xenococcaceae cyanobacterium MO_188.B32]|nr:carboxypeptidase regulatory-like domain-containing protein [Xenococcaceae cyanobacterium MO_188.B32]
MTNRHKLNYLASFLLFASLGFSRQVLAHGANIVYQQTPAIEVKATYDDGKPMSNAQVVIYAPDNPAIPWLKGKTNEEGKFSFIPQSNISGNWDIKIRQSGHGDIISIPWQTENVASTVESRDNMPNSSNWLASANNNYNPIQKVVMAATGVWGFIGTALFFSRQKSS